MAKHLKLNIKNTQIAEAINLGGLKSKLAKKKEEESSSVKTAPAAEKAPPKKKSSTKEPLPSPEEESALKNVKEEGPRIRARSKSVFAEGSQKPAQTTPINVVSEPPPLDIVIPEEEPKLPEIEEVIPPSPKISAGEELRRKVFGEEAIPPLPEPQPLDQLLAASETIEKEEILPPQKPEPQKISKPQPKAPEHERERAERPQPQKIAKKEPFRPLPPKQQPKAEAPPRSSEPYVKLGPTGRHIKDLFSPKPPRPKEEVRKPEQAGRHLPPKPRDSAAASPIKVPPKVGDEFTRKSGPPSKSGTPGKSGVKEFKDVSKPAKRLGDGSSRPFNVRDLEEEQRWRKKRSGKPMRMQEEIAIIRPTSLKVRIPISIKDLASEMKLKASELISKLFLQGLIVTLNDLLSDETTIQLLGQEFGCEIVIDTSEEQRIRITDKSVKEEIKGSKTEDLILRPPVVAFMGHVDHGKTSLIDSIRKSNRAAGEAGAITQHMGAFRCHTSVGDITILDTPGHEAFSAMRARGADVTDIVVLVVAGDEGMRQQTIEAMLHAKAAKVTIVVAINKSDKPAFNPENVYRQLSEHELLPEAWGGQTLTVNCSALTGAGIQDLLEMLALQAEILELKANPHMRARGTVLETEVHKGMGSVATVLVQNGTLRLGDSIVFGQNWGRVKTMRDEFGKDVIEAGPSAPVEITGLSGLPEAGQEFIVVKSEREAREISDARMIGVRQLAVQQKKTTLTVENLLQQATPSGKKVLNIVLRADVQGSLEALRSALEKIESTKAQLHVIFAGVGEVSESDIQLASTSKGMVLGFHTAVESHADSMIKQLNVPVRLHDIIYHAIDDVKAIMTGMLDRIAQENDRGKAEVKALFKSSHAAGVIAGCTVIDGVIQRNFHIRIMRNGKLVGKAPIASVRRNKDDVREVSKGMECGIALNKFADILVGDILEAYEITYITQEL